ncbi:MAG: PPC domain-containing protein [Treponema sp.]|nr:PPC domain-containing protein [Treponema sp.]
MKKSLLLFFSFVFTVGILFAQANENHVQQMDEAVKNLAREIHAKLAEKRAEKLLIGTFTFLDNQPPFSAYLVNQLTVELTNTPRRNYTIHTGTASDAQWTLVGEIIQVADIIRIYSRLIRVSDRAIEGSFITSFQRNEHITNMMVSTSGTSGGGVTIGGTSTWESPFSYTIGSSSSMPVTNRTLTEGAEDFFLLVPQRDGRLTMETTGSVDTYMHFYNYDNEDELASDDDSGQGLNARISHNVRAGVRYLAVVRGYSSSITGAYGFRAFLTVREGASSFENPIAYEISIGEENIRSVNRTLQRGDEDYFLLIPSRSGRITIETTGRTDTYMELYDADEELLAEDDDSGQSYNARIRYNVTEGNRYIALVRGYSNEITGSYAFRAFFPEAGLLAPDEYEPNNEPSQATPFTIGTTQRHTFHSSDDVDWIRFEVTRAGRHVISARGENNNRLDTYIELYDNNLNIIAEDDDGGDGLSARLSLNLAAGVYFLKVWCLDEEPSQAYILSITAQ